MFSRRKIFCVLESKQALSQDECTEVLKNDREEYYP